MSWHYLQGQEEECWEESCLDGAPSALLNLIPIVEEFSCRDREMGSLNHFQSGMMSRPLMEPDGEDLLTSSQEDSHVKISQQLEKEKESKERSQDSGLKWQESFVKYCHNTSLWRTLQCSLLEGLDVFSETWPRWGIMQHGVCWERTTLVHHTRETGSGSWLATPTATANQLAPSMMKHPGCRAYLPTPTASPSGYNRSASPNAKLRPSLGYMAKHNKWPTPTASEHAAGTPDGKMQKMLGNHPLIRGTTPEEWQSGTLNPDWVEWLMGWPIGWTDSEPLAMDKYQQWLHSHGIHSMECLKEESNDPAFS